MSVLTLQEAAREFLAPAFRTLRTLLQKEEVQQPHNETGELWHAVTELPGTGCTVHEYEVSETRKVLVTTGPEGVTVSVQFK